MRTSKAVSDYLVECEARGLARSTISQYEWALTRVVSRCGGIPQTGKRLLPALADAKLSAESRKDLLKCWRTFFRWYERQEWPGHRKPTNPVQQLRLIDNWRKLD